MLDRPPFTRYYWNGEAFKEMGGASGDRYTPDELAALATPLRAGTLVADATGLIYGQSDGAGGYTDAASPPAFRLTESTNSSGTKRTRLHGRDATLVPAGENQASISSLFANGELWNNVGLAATVPITASIAGTVMTVTAVGIATNLNGSTLAGAVNRGHFVTGDAGIPAGTHIIFNPSDTGDHGTGTYSLSADCGTIASKTLSLSCVAGVGGVMERVSDTYFGSAGGSADPNSPWVWRLSIKPTHRVTAGHGRALMLGEYMYPRKRYRVEQMLRLHYVSSSGWQTIGSATTIPETMAIAAISPTDVSGFDAATQYVTSGVFSVNYQRGGIRAFMRTPDEEYAIKAGDGFWSWTQNDERYRYDQEDYMYILKGLEPIKLVYEVFFDERMKSEGGKGWLKCWINNRLILDHQGPTLFPAGRLDGLVPPVQARLGMYDVSYPVVADNTLCSTIKSTATERNLHVKYFRVLEMS